MVSVPVKLSELQQALLSMSVGESASIESEAYICLETGRIYFRSDWQDENDPLPDDLDTSDRYLPVPDKHELAVGRDLALAFIEDASPRDVDRVAGFFRRRGAYARFKDLLADRGLLERWYEYENRAEEAALRAWCAEHDIRLADE